MKRCVALAVVLIGACGKRDAEKQPVAPAPEPIVTATDASPQACEQLPFAETTPVPEASGAAWMTLDGALSLVVVSDSGHSGAFAIVDPETGTTRSEGKLPLGSGASDDIEGLAGRGTRMYGLTSAGMMRVWEWKAGAFVLVDGPYPIGASGVDVCADPKQNNCTRDYEGLALAPTAPTTPNACVGVACARADGTLYCLTESGGKLRVDGTRTIPIDRKMTVADCAMSDAGALYTGNNVLGLLTVRRIDGWAEPKTAKVTEIAQIGPGFPEVIAVRNDVMYRMSDLGGKGPSAMAKFRCPSGTR